MFVTLRSKVLRNALTLFLLSKYKLLDREPQSNLDVMSETGEQFGREVLCDYNSGALPIQTQFDVAQNRY